MENASVGCGIMTLPNTKCGRVHRAHIHFLNMDFLTAYQPSIEVAVEEHILLVDLRRTMTAAYYECRHRAEERAHILQRVYGEVLARHSISRDGISIRTRFRMRPYKWLGRREVSSASLSFEDMLPFRQKFLIAYHAGWSEFREVLIEILELDRRLFRRREPLSRHEAEKYADELYACAAPWREELQERKKRRREARSVACAERMVLGVLGALRRARAEQRKAADAARRELARERWAWFRRDLTTEELMQGLPAHLRLT